MFRTPIDAAGRIAGTLLLLLLTTGCATRPASAPPPYEADGLFARFERIRVAPSDTDGFERLMERCVVAATAASLPTSHEWLCYREAPGRYWIITFSVTIDGFVYPPAFADFVESIGATESDAARAEVAAMLEPLELESEIWLLTRQRAAWSTVSDMSTTTHPKARVMARTVRPGMDAAFDAALTARTAFLRDHGYPLPIEGFVTLDAEPPHLVHSQMQVVFAVDWPSFHATESFGAFVKTLDQPTQDAYADRKAALMPTMSRAEFFDGAHAPELRYDTASGDD